LVTVVLVIRLLWCGPRLTPVACKQQRSTSTDLPWLVLHVCTTSAQPRLLPQREAQAFIKLREEMTGGTHKNAPMSWKEFHTEMTEFMEHQKTKRGALLDSRWNPLLQAHKEL
jgi:hypothetical protein